MSHLIRLRYVFVQGLAVLVLAAGSLQGAPLGEPGASYKYLLSSDISGRPEEAVKSGAIVVSARFSLGPEVRISRKTYQWFEINFTRQNGKEYAAHILMDGWPSSSHEPKVARYLWHEPDWADSLEYVNETSGKPELPRFAIWQYGWPQTEDGKSPVKFSKAPKNIFLHGWSFKLEGVSTKQVVVPSKVTRIALNPDLIIGLTGVHRDVDGRHKNALGRDHYDYIDPPAEDDWRADIDAGLNLFHGNKQARWLWRTGCYISQMFINPDDWPANIYRSNYWGRAWMIDEPTVYNYAKANIDNSYANDKLSPIEGAKLVEKVALDHLNRTDNNYGNRILGIFVDRAYGKGNLDIVERDYPVWEAFWQSGWYEMAAEGSNSGLVDEDVNPEYIVEQYNATLGIQIPPSVENACAIRIAVGRGAARNFHKNWGTAIYAYSKGALNTKIDMALLKYMYDAGATYFWHWNCWPGLSDAHVPYPYKRAYAASLRQFYRENPRDMDKLLHAAKVCIVLPNGFAFSAGPIHQISWLHLDRKTSGGVTYRQVLRNAGLEAERCIRMGTKFDMAIDEPKFKPHDYDELIYCGEDGKVRIVRPGKKDEILSEGRTPKRPDLGPTYAVDLDVVSVPDTLPGTVQLKAVGVPGTGETAVGMLNENAVWWEIVTPEGGSVYPFGNDVSFEAKLPGTYTIRAAICDCFGRPSVATTSITLK